MSSELSRTKKIVITLISVALIVIAVVVISYIFRSKTDVSDNAAPEETAAAQTAAVSKPQQDDTAAGSETTGPPEGWFTMYESFGPPDKTINFESYRKRCPDVYAWIDVPGTEIYYPVAYCEDSDKPFYFTHDIDGNPSEKGMVITDSMNTADFSEPMTLVYGQNPDDGTVFAQLHRFRDAGFFDEHEKFSIYLDDVQLIYRIYACYIDSDDHIFVTYDFYDPEGFTGYFDHIGEIRDLSMNIRTKARPELGDRVVALITHCDDESKRLFVVGVLDEVRY